MTNPLTKLYRNINFVGDIIILNIAFVLSYVLKFGTLFNNNMSVSQLPLKERIFEDPYFHSLLLFNSLWILLVFSLKPYNYARGNKLIKYLFNYLGVVLLHFLFMSSVFVILKVSTIYSREQFLTTYLVFVGLILILKVATFYTVQLLLIQGYNRKKMVVVGYGELTQELTRLFKAHPEYGYEVNGIFGKPVDGNQKTLGAYEDVFNYCIDNQVDEIYCFMPCLSNELVRKIIHFGDDNLIRVKLLTDFRGFSSKSVSFERLENIPILNVTSMPLDDHLNKQAKRVFDLVFSSLVLIFVCSWLFPLIAILIKLDSKGPVFFTQRRSGLDNDSFSCIKFRTMSVDNKAQEQQASRGDSRVTKVGRFLRSSSLDEMPQFINVFLGNMSVVGPRPHMIAHTEEYSKVVQKFMMRHFVKPGITGLAQAKGFRGSTEDVNLMKNRVKLDRFYVENWSIVFDIKIIFLTIYSILKGQDSAF